MFNGMQGGMGAGGWVLMAVLWIAVLALVAWVVARLLPTRSDDRHHVPRAPSEGPRDTLDRRLAGGEIDVKTYDELSEKLGPRAAAGRG
jgi:putative membrane protein